MQLIKRVVINGNDVKLVNDNLVRELQTPGVAVLVVESDKPLAGGNLVQYSLGWRRDSVRIWFLGYIEQVIPMDNRQRRLLVRELPATLNRRLPLALRHCSVSEVLAAIAADTGLQFTLGKGEWRDRRAPFFFHTGGGYLAMDSIGAAFRIPNYVWQLQSDGRVYVGSWSGLPDTGAVVPVPVRNLTAYTAGNSASVPTLPRFHPGIRIQIGDNDPVIITRVEQQGAGMRLAWCANPWDQRVKRTAAA